MRKDTIFIRYILLFAVSVIFLFCPGKDAKAAQPYPGSITVVFGSERQGKAQEGIPFYCAQVAFCTGRGYVLRDEYRSSGVDFGDIETAVELRDAAEKLSKYRLTKAIQRKTDRTGTAKFENLAPGIYLIKSDDSPGHDMICPALTEVPKWSAREKDMSMNVTVRPKHAAFKTAKKAQAPKTGEDGSEVHYYLRLSAAAALLFAACLACRRMCRGTRKKPQK